MTRRTSGLSGTAAPLRRARSKIAGTSLVVDWDVNDVFSFKSITSERSLDWTGTRDADNTPLLILHTNYTSKSEQFSQELQALLDTSRADG